MNVSQQLFASLAMSVVLALPSLGQEAHVGSLTGHVADGKK